MSTDHYPDDSTETNECPWWPNTICTARTYLDEAKGRFIHACSECRHDINSGAPAPQGCAYEVAPRV